MSAPSPEDFIVASALAYRGAILQMKQFVDALPYAGDFIANYQLGENMAPMVEYVLGRTEPLPIIELDSNACPLFLTFNLKEWPVNVSPRWHMVWHGARIRDIKTYELRLYARN